MVDIGEELKKRGTCFTQLGYVISSGGLWCCGSCLGGLSSECLKNIYINAVIKYYEIQIIDSSVCRETDLHSKLMTVKLGGNM